VNVEFVVQLSLVVVSVCEWDSIICQGSTQSIMGKLRRCSRYDW